MIFIDYGFIVEYIMSELLEGEVVTYHNTGCINVRSFYVQGMLHSEYSQYRENGVLELKCSQTKWKEDGTSY